MGTKMVRRYAKTTKLSRLEREILCRWFDSEDLDSGLVERFVKRYESEWGGNWSVPGDYQIDELVVGTLASVRFERVEVLSSAVLYSALALGSFELRIECTKRPGTTCSLLIMVQ
jgi:hypothetical protein